MKTKIEFEIDYYEEREMLHHILKAHDYYMIINEVDNLIRMRLKHCDEMTKEEERFLEEIREYLLVE